MLLFLSHSGADSASAIELKRRILASLTAQETGLEVWLDKHELAGGDNWQIELEHALQKADAFCVYVGSTGVINWVEREVRLGLSRATGADAIPFVAALAPSVASSSVLPPFARQHQAVRDPLGDPDALMELVAALLGGAAAPHAPQLIEHPFIGLRAMDEADAQLFLGREVEVEELAAKLRAHPIVAVVADSGAGKSSLARAGLAPAFRGGAVESENRLQPDGAFRHVVVMRPGPVQSVAFSPDGTRLATASDDGTARLWDLSGIPKGNAFDIACAWLPLRSGVLATDLGEALGDQALVISDPICNEDYDPPTPWWLTSGATEPQPPAVLK